MNIFKNFNKEKFLSWPQYSKLITEIEHWTFVNATARESIYNYWRYKK